MSCLLFQNNKRILLESMRLSSWFNHPGHKNFRKTRMETFPFMFFDDVYTDEPQYPPVKPKYPSGSWGNMDPKLAWQYAAEGEEFHSLLTIPERLAVISYENCRVKFDHLRKPFVHRRSIWLLSGKIVSAHSLDFFKYITNTHIIDGLPETYQHVTEPIDLENSSKIVKDILSTNLYFRKRPVEPVIDTGAYVADVLRKEKEAQENEQINFEVVSEIVHGLMRLYIKDMDSYLFNVDVPICGWWKRSGFEKVFAKGKYNPDKRVISFQFRDKAIAQIKRNLPLPEVVSFSDPLCNTQVEKVAYNPTFYKVFTDQILPTQIPGHWYGDDREFNVLTIYSTTSLAEIVEKYGPEELPLALKGWAIRAGHAELTAQAYYLGFSMWKDISYPLTAQIILTDGIYWTFVIYQLNSLELYKDENSNVKTNLCWISQPMKLYERITENGSDIEGFNVECLNCLCNFITRRRSLSLTEVSSLRPFKNDESSLSERHKLLSSELYDICRHCREQTEYDPRTVNAMTGTNFFKKYSDVTARFRDIVRAEYPKKWWGKQLDFISRKNKKPNPKDYDILEEIVNH